MITCACLCTRCSPNGYHTRHLGSVHRSASPVPFSFSHTYRDQPPRPCPSATGFASPCLHPIYSIPPRPAPPTSITRAVWEAIGRPSWPCSVYRVAPFLDDARAHLREVGAGCSVAEGEHLADFDKVRYRHLMVMRSHFEASIYPPVQLHPEELGKIPVPCDFDRTSDS